MGQYIEEMQSYIDQEAGYVDDGYDRGEQFGADRVIDSTDTNEYADGGRDETQWEDDIVDTAVANADIIPDRMNEDGTMDRPLYDENGYGDIPDMG